MHRSRQIISSGIVPATRFRRDWNRARLRSLWSGDMVEPSRPQCNQYLGLYQARVVAKGKLFLVYESTSLRGSV